jgi:ATP-dependent Clp protease adapter protein ClpS
MAQTTISPTRSPSRETGAEDETRHEQTSLYRVVLLNDAFRHAQEVDARGRTVLITCELSQAEFARDQIQMYGPDWRLPQSKGSMSALVEPAA